MAGLGDYELEGLIGRGSMGAVYRGRHRAGGKAVAIKRMRWAGDDQLVGRVRAEAAAVAGLRHPHIVRVEEVLDDEDALVIVMQLAEGGSLGEMLLRGVRLPPQQAAELVAMVAEALAAAHELSVAHSDVKPSNILIDGNGVPLLSDFGLSRWTSGATPGGGLLLGTAEYLDPEVAAGAPPGAASDIYSLGIVGYEALTGQLPYQGATPLATVRAADRGRWEPLTQVAPDIPAGLAGVVEQAMSRRRHARQSTAGELAEALRLEIQDRWPSHRTAEVADNGHGPIGDTGRATGPRPLRPRRPTVDRRRPLARPTGDARVPLVAASATTLLVVLALAAWPFAHNQVVHGSSRACRTTAAGPRQSGLPTAGETVLADVDGDGCRVPLRWSSGVITVSLSSSRTPARFALGQAGDQLLLGDWDCRRRATPALYRPSTGQVFYFAGWAQPGHDLAPRDDSTPILDGVARVVRAVARGCDRVAVAPPESRRH
jgi:hypothetical protein